MSALFSVSICKRPIFSTLFSIFWEEIIIRLFEIFPKVAQCTTRHIYLQLSKAAVKIRKLLNIYRNGAVELVL